ncbi:MAG: hypothetical protein FJ213_12520 [Ignavibacteria bacterium]|nr:hypothetical protein [Ignavibacteria bacterium]
MIKDKKAFSVVSLLDESNDKTYWLSKTPQEKIQAIEFLRQTMYGYDPTTTRLQRFFEVVELKKS